LKIKKKKRKTNMSMDLDVQKEPQEEEVVDEYLLAFEAVEQEALNEATVLRYNEMLLNERTDDVAVKIKEKCIYKVAKHHSGNLPAIFLVVATSLRTHALTLSLH
jgi:hypothetical protein